MINNAPAPLESQKSQLVPSLSSEESDEDEIQVLDVLIFLAERKSFVFAVTGIFAITAVVVSLVLPKRYTAMVTLLPPQQSSSSLSAMLTSQLGGLGSIASTAGSSLGIKNPNDMYVAMLKSRTVEDSMVQRFNLMQEYHTNYPSDARTALEHHAEIDGGSKDGLIHLSIDDKDARRAAELANGYVEEYQRLSEHLAITEASQRRLFFERQLEQAKNNLASAEEALKTTEQSTGLIELDSQAKMLIQSAATLRAQITAKEVQIEGMRTYATGENFQLAQAEQELQSLRAQLARLGGGGEGKDDGLLVPMGRVPKVGLDYVRKVRDVKYYETIFEIIARQFEAAKLDEAKQGAIIQVVDPAVTPDRRSWPKRGLIIIVATIAGFFIGLILALAQGAYKHLSSNLEFREKLQILGRHLFHSAPRP